MCAAIMFVQYGPIWTDKSFDIKLIMQNASLFFTREIGSSWLEFEKCLI
jgi:hypothetical protein